MRRNHHIILTDMVYDITKVDDRYRIEILKDKVSMGLLYFERAKKGFINKPITSGWVCVDATIDPKLYEDETITPKGVIDKCYTLLMNLEKSKKI
jgi:hypothetical protein